jgi:type I restriction enzyme S subunit
MDDRTDAQLDSSLIPQPSSLSTRRFRPYPEYQNSGAEWIGEIPSHWSTKRLKNVVHFQGGGTPSKENLEYWSGNIPWVSPKDMKTRLILDTVDKITVEAVEQSATNLVDPGAVLLVVRSGILNHSIPIAIAGTTVALNQDLKALIPGAEVLPKYLSYVIDGKQSPLLVEWRKEGATVESLELELIENSRFPLPPKSEQHAIVEFLDRETEKIDALMAKKERLIELFLEKRTALITHAVTMGLDPDIPMKDSGVEWLGNIPAHWEVKRLKRIAQISYGIVLELDRTLTEGTPIISLPNVSIDGELNLRDIPFTPLRRDEREALLLKKGDLLFNWRNGSSDHVGKTALFDAEGDYTHVSFLLRVRFSGGGFIPRFYQRYLNSLRFTGFFMATKAGVNNTFNQSELMELEVLVPPANEQLIIATFLDQEMAKLDALIAKIREGIARLKEFRTALISAAVTGKIDVREEVA